MFEKAILPLAIAILVTALGGVIGLYFKGFENISDRVKKLVKILFWILIATAILVLIIGLLILPTLPANLMAEQTSIAATGTEIANRVRDTQIAGTNTQQAGGTQTATAEIMIADRATATYAAASTQVAQQVRDNAVLCRYATNPDALESAVGSQRLLLWPLGISILAIIIFLVASYPESNSRKVFIALLVVSILGLMISISLYANHPLSKLPQGFSFSSNEGVNQLLLEECSRQSAQQINATQTSVALEAQPTYQTLTQAAIETEQTRTQSAIETEKANSRNIVASQTAVANLTATQTTYELWYAQHQFVDEFDLDQHGWSGDDQSSHVELDRSGSGKLIYKSNTKRPASFWKCDLCSVPNDQTDYSFEVKYIAPGNASGFNFGFLFGCTQFDESLVNCQGIQVSGSSKITILQIGPKVEYEVIGVDLAPNQKGFVSLRWEVRNRRLTLWVNDSLVAGNIGLNSNPGGMFGLYQDPSGFTVEIERIEIAPIP